MAIKPSMKPSIRERIMRVLEARFKAVREGKDDHVLTWNTVARRVLTDAEQIADKGLSLLDPDEIKFEEVGYIRVELTVITEFWINLNQGDNSSEQLGLVLADVQRTMRQDIYCFEDPSDTTTQLTINIQEQSNEYDTDGPADLTVGGVIRWAVTYRHGKQDSRDRPTRG